MGRTVPSYRVASDREKRKWTLFRQQLDKSERKNFDEKLDGPMAGKQLSDYLAAGANGSLYINIHTERNPNGEIRGQSGGN